MSRRVLVQVEFAGVKVARRTVSVSAALERHGSPPARRQGQQQAGRRPTGLAAAAGGGCEESEQSGRSG